MGDYSHVLLMRNMNHVKLAAKAFKKNSKKDKSILNHLANNPDSGIVLSRRDKIENITWGEYSVEYEMSNGDIHTITLKLGVHIYDSRAIIPMTELVVFAWSDLRTSYKQFAKILKQRHPLIFGNGLVKDMPNAVQPDGFNVVHDEYIQTANIKALEEKIASVIYDELCELSVEELRCLEWTATNRFREGHAAVVSSNGYGVDDDSE